MLLFQRYHISLVAISSILLSFEAQAMWEPDGEDTLSSSPKIQTHSPEKTNLRDSQVSQEKNQLLADLQEKIGYRFKDTKLLTLAFLHSSEDKGQTPSGRGYQRLEFLGDGVLEYTMREILWNDFPHLNNGKLRDTCSILVANDTLAHISQDLQLPQLSKKLNLAPAAYNPSSLSAHNKADFVESLVAAIYEDGGIEASKAFVQRYWKSPQAPKYIKGIFLKQSRALAKETRKTPHAPLTRLNFDKKYDDSLSFLGEGILELVLTEHLYKEFPEDSEGNLTKKYIILTSIKSIEKLCKKKKMPMNHSLLKTSLGKKYLKDGLQKTAHYILSLWVGGEPTMKLAESLAKETKEFDTTKTFLQVSPSAPVEMPVSQSPQADEAPGVSVLTTPKESSESVDSLIMNADRLFKEGNFKVAIHNLNRALDRLTVGNPLYEVVKEKIQKSEKAIAAKALLKKGNKSLTAKNYKDALSLFKQALEKLTPESPLYQKAKQGKANARKFIGQTTKTATSKSSKKKVSPQKPSQKKENTQLPSVQTLMKKGNDFLKQRLYGEAHRTFSDVLDQISMKDPHYQFALDQKQKARKRIVAETSLKYGYSFVTERKEDEALACFNRALNNLDPEDPLYQETLQAIENTSPSSVQNSNNPIGSTASYTPESKESDTESSYEDLYKEDDSDELYMKEYKFQGKTVYTTTNIVSPCKGAHNDDDSLLL
jgi:dsRNA-specific ribonuclease